MKKSSLIIIIVLIALTFIILPTDQLLAASCDPAIPENAWLKTIIPPDGLIIPCECLSKTKENIQACSSTTMIFQTIVNVSQLILAVTGAAALLMLAYGGTLWIVAAGSQEMIQKGKQAIMAAAIGIVVILGAWLIVNFTILAVTGGTINSPAQIFQQSWFGAPSGGSSPQ